MDIDVVMLGPACGLPGRADVAAAAISALWDLALSLLLSAKCVGNNAAADAGR